MGYILFGGEKEIRTLEGVATLPLFESGAFNHSAISPRFFILTDYCKTIPKLQWREIAKLDLCH